MQNILIPTDFSIRSLNIITQLAEKGELKTANITLVHMMDIPTSIQDLLFISRSRLEHQALITKQFSEACEILKNRFSSNISSLSVRFLYGSTYSFFRNFLEAKEITLVAYSNSCNFKKVSKHSVDMHPMIKKVKVPSMEFKLNAEAGRVHNMLIADLLPSENKMVAEA